MDKHLQGQNINVEVPFVDDKGQPITDVTKVSWQLFDEDENRLDSGEQLISQGKSLVIVADKAHNLINHNEVFAVRLLSSKLHTHSGREYVQRYYYMLETESTLIVCQNSFLTYMQALRLMPEIADLISFSGATEDARKTALINAYRNISSLSLTLAAAGTDIDKLHYANGDERPYTAGDWTPEDWTAMNEKIKHDFRIAQLIEAEGILGGDGVGQLRAQGVMSYSVGEVKQFYRTSQPLELSVSKAALRVIGKYIQYNRGIGRA